MEGGMPCAPQRAPGHIACRPRALPLAGRRHRRSRAPPLTSCTSSSVAAAGRHRTTPTC
uniref:Uncharacterized protein n=1 Tax=Setaria italica TaxID=4555 RepID=K3Y3U1_SETIT